MNVGLHLGISCIKKEPGHFEAKHRQKLGFVVDRPTIQSSGARHGGFDYSKHLRVRPLIVNVEAVEKLTCKDFDEELK